MNKREHIVVLIGLVLFVAAGFGIRAMLTNVREKKEETSPQNEMTQVITVSVETVVSGDLHALNAADSSFSGEILSTFEL